MIRVARYDGQADWYDESASGSAAFSRDAILELIGPAGGEGPCLDLGCGTGVYADILREAGFGTVVGVDLSADQLRIGKGREPVALGDGARLPFRDEGFGFVACIWVHGDLDDLRGVLVEARRVLRPGGRALLFGVHPCFNGPCVEGREDGARIVHPTYRESGWHETSPWWSAEGIRHRVGVRHRPLAELLNDVLASGLQLTSVAEPRSDAVPYVLALNLKKRGSLRGS